MNVCDLCNAPLGANATRYTASQIKEAVRAGLRPSSISLELGAAFGMSKEDTERAWIRQVAADNTDWLLCPACRAKYEQYASRKKW